MTKNKNRKGYNMFQKRKRKRKKQSSVLYVDATNKSPERAISEFKRRVKNSNLLKELRDREFYEKPSVARRRRKKLRLQKVRSINND
jgi:small subunit ribosomal protein S21|tara:strand:- start:43 stop:303 length:261 start_codon:yes stop_codon:yes gene_type:complete